MLLFQKRFHEGLTKGEVTLTFRRWAKPHVKAGGRYRCHPIGVLEVDRVDRIAAAEITTEDARRSGFETKEALLAYMHGASEEPLTDEELVYRIELRHGGDGDRVPLALETSLSAEDVAAITASLARLDAKGRWTKKTLALIDRRPRVAASKLALELGRETLDLKADIRKLKRLGLTQSFEVGYEISPRGRAYAEAIAKRAPKPKKSAASSNKERRRT